MNSGIAAKTVLITGASSGIGHASAKRLHDAGLTVYATARRPDAVADLAAEGIRTLPLDVTDDQSMQDAVSAIENEAGPIGILINNAAYGLYGPVEQRPLGEVRALFDTNFFGLVRLTQLVLPSMRRAGAGRIINLSSMGGRATLPGGAFYHASKYAVEALSDALRIELALFGIDVVLIEPGPVRTPFMDLAVASLATATSPSGAGDPYKDFKDAIARSFTGLYTGPIARFVSTLDDIARVVTMAATARRPRTRYLVSLTARSMIGMKRWLPDRANDALLARQFGLPRSTRPSTRRPGKAAPSLDSAG